MKRIPEEQKKLAGYYWNLFKSTAGEHVLADLRARFASGTPFDPASDRVTSFWCGQQDVVRYIDNMIHGARLPEENGDNNNYLEGEEDA